VSTVILLCLGARTSEGTDGGAGFEFGFEFSGFGFGLDFGPGSGVGRFSDTVSFPRSLSCLVRSGGGSERDLRCWGKTSSGGMFSPRVRVSLAIRFRRSNFSASPWRAIS
jgi:hypothetical protein